MLRLLKILPAVIILLLPLYSEGQRLYAPNGLGILVPDNSGRSRGMGGAGIANADGMNMLLVNPALDASFKTAWYSLGFVYNHTTTYTGGAESPTFAKTDPTLVKFVIPVVPGFVIGWGLAPYSKTDSKLFMPVSPGDIYTDTMTSSGGINISSFEIAGSYKKLAVGASLRYNFGAIQEEWYRSFGDSNYIDTTHYLNKKLSGYTVALGIVASVTSKTKIGLSYLSKSPLDMNVTVLPGSSADTEISVEKDKLYLPANWHAGVYSEITRNLSAAVDFSQSYWSDAARTAKEKLMYNSTYSLNAGIRFVPSTSPLAGYFAKIPISAGFRMGNQYYKSYPQISEIPERALTFGLEFPFKKNTGSLFTSFEFGTRGDKDKNGWDETFVNAAFSIVGKIK